MDGGVENISNVVVCVDVFTLSIKQMSYTITQREAFNSVIVATNHPFLVVFASSKNASHGED
jgi:hypothetical protein